MSDQSNNEGERMGKFLTDAARIEQIPKKGMYKVLDNELYQDDDGFIYLVWRGFQTDNFTWIRSVSYTHLTLPTT